MGNPITNKLPYDIDSFLQDIAQMENLFSYGDIMEFGNRVKEEDIEKLTKLKRQSYEEYQKYGKISEKTLIAIKQIVVL